jgi:hypothetical protein
MKFAKVWLPRIIFSVVIFVLVSLTPEKIYYSKTGNRVEIDTIIILIIFVIPLAVLPFFYRNKLLLFYTLFAAFGFIGYFLATQKRSIQIETELQANSIKVSGLVKKRRYQSPAKGNSYWEFLCEFEYRNVTYSTFWQSDLKNLLREGDTVEVYFLTRNPEISKIKLP